MATQDLIGKRGEAIVMSCLLDFDDREYPYFDPHPLGEKCPTFDYLVELLDAGTAPAYFLVQVKSTRQGRDGRQRLKTGVSEEDVQKMARCPLPAYVIGVDDRAGLAYIVSVHGRAKKAISTIPKDYPLNADNRKVLWREVRDHWARVRKTTARTSAFRMHRGNHADG